MTKNSNTRKLENLEQILMNKFKNDELHILKNDEDTFTFSCDCCGTCCINRHDIILSPYDMFNLCREYELSPSYVIDKYCKITIGNNSKLPIVFVDFKKIAPDLEVCPFLTPLGDDKHSEKMGCSIHKAKPFICAIYPLGRITKKENDKTEILYFDQQVKCSKCKTQKENTLKSWLNDFNVKEAELNSDIFSEFMFNIMQKFNFVEFANNKMITKKTKNMVYNAWVSALFGNLDTKMDSIEFFKERFEVLEQALMEMKKMGILLTGAKL